MTFPGNSGGRITGRYYPLDDARGVVVCVHPDRRYGGHWFVRSGWVHFLVAHGFEVLTFDLVGYGGSQGPATYYHEDVREAVRFARRWSGQLDTHVVGVSMGAHSAACASPWLEEVGAMILESPPASLMSFARGPLSAIGVRMLERAFPRTAAMVQAEERISEAAPRRILVAATAADAVTPVALSRAIAKAAPAERTRYLEFEDVPHLGLFEQEAYRETVLEVLGVHEGTASEAVLTASCVSGRRR